MADYLTNILFEKTESLRSGRLDLDISQMSDVNEAIDALESEVSNLDPGLLRQIHNPNIEIRADNFEPKKKFLKLQEEGMPSQLLNPLFKSLEILCTFVNSIISQDEDPSGKYEYLYPWFKPYWDFSNQSLQRLSKIVKPFFDLIPYKNNSKLWKTMLKSIEEDNLFLRYSELEPEKLKAKSLFEFFFKMRAIPDHDGNLNQGLLNSHAKAYPPVEISSDDGVKTLVTVLNKDLIDLFDYVYNPRADKDSNTVFILNIPKDIVVKVSSDQSTICLSKQGQGFTLRSPINLISLDSINCKVALNFPDEKPFLSEDEVLELLHLQNDFEHELIAVLANFSRSENLSQ